MSGSLYRSLLVVLAMFLLVAPLCPTPAWGAGWQSRGIGGGGALFSPSISPHDNNLVFMATDMSSVFRSEDFGRNWTTIDFRVLIGGYENCQVRFTSNPLVLYTINQIGEVQTPSKSLDGGKTWSPLPGDPTEQETYSLYADPGSTVRLVVSSYDTLFFSNDGGATFSLAYAKDPILPADGLRVSGVLWDGANIFVGTSDGLIVSTNGGASFARSTIPGIPTDEVIVSFAGATQDGSVRFLAVTSDTSVWTDIPPGDLIWSYRGVYRLNWGEAAWVKVVTGIADCAGPAFVGMAANNINVAYVAGGSIYPCDGFPIIFKTTNGGDSWTDVFLTTNNQNIITGWCGNGGDRDWWYPEYAMGFDVCLNNPNRAIITDFGFAHVTEDGGVTWRQAYVQTPYQNPAGNPTPTGKYYAGNGVEDTSVWWLDWLTADTLFASFTDIRGILSTDRGQTWMSGFSFGLPYNTTYYSLKHPVSGKVYAATSSTHDIYQSYELRDSNLDDAEGNVIVSSDNGQTWETLHDFVHAVIWLALHPSQPDTMYASVIHSTEGGIFVTHNLSAGAGSTWTRLALPPRTQGHPYNIHVLKDGTLIASYSARRTEPGDFTDSSGIFVSTDGGVSWQDRSDPNMHYWTKDVVIDPHDPVQNIWYVGVFSHWGAPPYNTGGLYRTTDRGLNWTRISFLDRVESATVHPQDPNLLYLTTEYEGLWITRNLRQVSPTFTLVADYPFQHPMRVFFNPYDRREIWVAAFGGGLRVQTGAAGGRSEALIYLLLLD